MKVAQIFEEERWKENWGKCEKCYEWASVYVRSQGQGWQNYDSLTLKQFVAELGCSNHVFACFTVHSTFVYVIRKQDGKDGW